MSIYEYKIAGTQKQYAAIDEAIKITQFIRNKCLRKWMDERGISANDLQCYCAVLAQEYSFASLLNSQARQVAADRAWSAIYRFYDNCREKKPGKKGYPQFQHDNRSVEYKQTGWKLDSSGKHLTFTDRCGIGRLQLVGNKKQYEDLKIANMVKNHHLAKSISDASWGRFLSWVNYYAALHDVPVIAVAPHFTSQQCSGCGKMVNKSLSERTHRCVFCGLVMDRDENAARNILYKALHWLKEQGCTVGHTATGTPGRVRKASGQKTTTASQN